jgi:hypothetical protein
MPKLQYAASTIIMNTGKNLLIVNGHLIMDAAFIYAVNCIPEYLESGLKTSFHIHHHKLIGFIQTDGKGSSIPGSAMKAFDGIELGKYGEARLYDEIPWMKEAVSSQRQELIKELRKTLSREGNRYLREQFIKQGEK